MKVAAAQIRPQFGRPEENREMTQLYCQRAAQQDVRLVVFPELSITGYNFPSRAVLEPLAEAVPQGPTTQLWIELAQAYDLIIVGGLAERGSNNKIYNSGVVVGPEGFKGCYRKIHLFGREPQFFASGTQPPQIFQFDDVVVGVLVCFDWAFPEVSRILMLEGCEVLCLPANLVLPLAQRVMIARSIENRFFTITANRVGKERELTFTGHSLITDCEGSILAQGSSHRTSLITAKIDPAEARNKQLTPTNHIVHDRRVELYQRLLQP